MQEASAFLDIMATSGNTYAFRQAVLLLPDDESDSAARSYVTSVTGFKPASPKNPTLVRLSSKRKPPHQCPHQWMTCVDDSLRLLCSRPYTHACGL